MKNEELTKLIKDINERIESLKYKNLQINEKLPAYHLIDRINASFNDDLTENVSKIFDLKSPEHQLFKASILLYITLIEQQENIGLTATNKPDNLNINNNELNNNNNGNNSTKLTTNSIQPSKTINESQMDLNNAFQVNDDKVPNLKNNTEDQTIANYVNKSNKTNLQIEDMKSNNPQNNTEEISQNKDQTIVINDNNQILVYDNEFITNLFKEIGKMKDLKDIGKFLNQLNDDDKLKARKLYELYLIEKKEKKVNLITENSNTKEDFTENKEILKFLEAMFTIPNKVKETLLIEDKKSNNQQNNTENPQITDQTIANKLSEILKVQIEILDSVGFLKAINQISENNKNSTDLDFFKPFDPNYVDGKNSENINIYQTDLNTLLKNNDVLNLVKECKNQDETSILTIINNINKDNYDELSDDARSNLFKIITFDRSIGEGDSNNIETLLGENINKAINDKSKEILKYFNQSHLEQLNKINTSTDDIPNENTNYFRTVLGSYANLLINPASFGVCIAIVASYWAGKNPSSDISNLKS